MAATVTEALKQFCEMRTEAGRAMIAEKLRDRGG